MSEATMFGEPGSVSDCRTLLSFRLGFQTYAFAVESIVQIISMVTITPIPQLEETVEGVINVQGTVVPVVDMRRHLGLAQASYDLYTPILLIHSGKWLVGLVVDEVLDVVNLRPEEFVSPTQVLPGRLGEAPMIRDLIPTGGAMTLYLDPDQLFLPHQRDALERAVKWISDLSEGADVQTTSVDGSQARVPKAEVA